MSVIDEIKERIDAVELISNYVQLKRTGRNYKGLCPFHAENTPSFVVFPETGTWHCFGACSEGGDIFTFVMKREGWDFQTALEELARQAGVELRPRTPVQEAEDQERGRLREIMTGAATYFHNLLLNAPQAEGAREYVTRRGLNERSIEAFQLGYALDEWHALESYMAARGYEQQELVAAGLLVEREDQRVYDRFRGRLMIPIRDRRGRTVAFGARTLDPEGVPKYLNSPQTLLFDKSSTLFGLDRALKGIRAAERAVIVEGYMDVIQAHQYGFHDVVAQLGTALTEENLKQLMRHTKRVILALDPDAAGQAATMRGLDVAREALEPEWEPVFDARGLLGVEARLTADIRVLTLPKGHDPDDLIRSDPARWAELVDQAVPLVEHYMQTLMRGQDLADPKVKGQLTESLAPVIRQVASPVERAHYAQKLARVLRVDERPLLEMVSSSPRRRPRRRRAAEEPAPRERARPDLEVYCLQGLLQIAGLEQDANTLLVEMQLDSLSTADFDDPMNREIFRVWQAWRKEGRAGDAEGLQALLPAELHGRLEELLNMAPMMLLNQKWLLEAQMQPGQDAFELRPEEVTEDVLNSLLKLRERKLRKRGTELRFLLEEVDAADARLYRKAIGELTGALARLQRLLISRQSGEPAASDPASSWNN
jgi:DNA primase